jgi:hypothetical protein
LKSVGSQPAWISLRLALRAKVAASGPALGKVRAVAVMARAVAVMARAVAETVQGSLTSESLVAARRTVETSRRGGAPVRFVRRSRAADRIELD